MANGGFTRAELSILPDGTGSNKKRSRYDDPKVYESEKPVDRETVDAIKKNVADTGLLAWAGLPDCSYISGDKRLTFVFSGGERISVRGGRNVPDQLSGGFFNVELEMTVKH